MKKEKPFNNPFAGLKLEAKKEPPRKVAPPPAPKKVAPTHEEDECALFLASVGEVEAVRGPRPVVARELPQAPRLPVEEEDVLTQLSELVAGEGPFDLVDSEESVEGSVSGLDRRIVTRLRRGEYALQGDLDLHGLSRAEAKDAVERFLLRCRQQGRRCVLIVHGRGLHSRDQIPILKEGVQGWLSQGKLARVVLAFSTARPQHGGAGAVYVLLRR